MWDKFKKYLKEKLKAYLKNIVITIFKTTFKRHTGKARYVFNAYLALSALASIYISIKISVPGLKHYITNWILAFFFLVCLYYFGRANTYLAAQKLDDIKYSAITELFNGKVKVLSYKEGVYTLHSFLTLTEIKNYDEKFEHLVNKQVTNIWRDSSNFKIIYIQTSSNGNKKLRETYPPYLR